MQSETKKKMTRGNIIMWVICIGIILAGAIIIICSKMPEKGSSYDHMKYTDYISALGEYKGLEGTLEKVTITKADVKAEIESRVSAEQTTKTVTKGKVADGDTVTIDYEGTIDGEEFLGGSAENQDLTIGSGTMIDGFESGLIGKKVGETVTLHLTFPESYDNANVAGKDADFKVTIKSRKVPVTYEYDEEFLKTFTDYDNKKDYEKAVKKELQEQRESEAENSCKASLWTQVLEATEVKEYPKPLYKTEKAKLQENAQEMASNYGMSWEDYLAAVGMDEASYNEQLKEQTKDTLKEHMTAYYIADQENIKVTADDAVEHIREELEENDMTVEEFEEAQGMSIEEYAENNDMEDHIIVEKVQDLIYDNAKITEVEASVTTDEHAGHEHRHDYSTHDHE